MSDKPVYQLRYGTGDVDVTEEQYFRESYMRGTPRRMLYPASDYEALKKENAEHKATISNLTKAYERESNDCLKQIEERDYWSDKADSLAYKISEVFDVPVGEHSNVNCPIDEANKILDGEYVTKFDKQVEALKAENAELRDRITIMDEAAKYYNETITGISNKLHAENEALKLKKEFIEYAAQDLENQNEALKADNEALRKQVEEHKEWHMMRDEIDRLRAREIELVDLLRSARCIAERQGKDTAWQRFSKAIEKQGIGYVTAKVFKVLESDKP